MASRKKRNKAKNSYMLDGGEKIKIGTLKRIYYFSKAQRHQLKKEVNKRENEG
jgi:hypothetical protein